MPISKRWSQWRKAHVKRRAENNYGVYELASTDEIIYIGQGKVLSRLLAHFPRGSHPVPPTSRYRYRYLYSATRAEERERALLREFRRRYGRLPRYNQRDESVI